MVRTPFNVRVIPAAARLLTLLLIVTCSFVTLPGCSSESGEGASPTPSDGPLRIVATTGMVGDVVAAVAGEHGEVAVLMKPGVDPHLYKPTRDDIAMIMDADAVFYNGLLLEGKMTDTLIRAATSGKPVYAVTELVEESVLLEGDEGEGHPDPHLWMDPAIWAQTIGVVRDRLSDLRPAWSESFGANAEAYQGAVMGLDAYAVASVETVSESQRVLVTAHDAFNYFGSRFGFEVVGIQGISTESEAGVSDIERLVDLLVDRKIGAVFVESTVSERNIKALIAGAAARGHEVASGGELFSDAMGEAGTYRGTYVGMIDHNITTIVSALGGTCPEGGMNGRLGED